METPPTLKKIITAVQTLVKDVSVIKTQLEGDVMASEMYDDLHNAVHGAESTLQGCTTLRTSLQEQTETAKGQLSHLGTAIANITAQTREQQDSDRVKLIKETLEAYTSKQPSTEDQEAIRVKQINDTLDTYTSKHPAPASSSASGNTTSALAAQREEVVRAAVRETLNQSQTSSATGSRRVGYSTRTR